MAIRLNVIQVDDRLGRRFAETHCYALHSTQMCRYLCFVRSGYHCGQVAPKLQKEILDEHDGTNGIYVHCSGPPHFIRYH